MAEEQGDRGDRDKKVFVDRMQLTLHTGNVTDAETNGEVYLVTAAREFNVKRAGIDDRRKGGRDVYRLGGDDSNIQNKERNNPAGIPLWVLNSSVIGLRFLPQPNTPPAPPDTWNLAMATLLVTGDDGLTDEYVLDDSLQRLWLGFHTTLTAGLRFNQTFEP
ncbi:MAG TPA: hypothetical protein VJ735_02085 [Actinomycetes bacterium]|nr:hypothetical protein [Actinomycetes bacterium]